VTEEEIRSILLNTKTIAVVGMSTKAGRPSQEVPLYLKAHGYKIIPVNPKATQVAGMEAYPDLLSIPEKVDLVEVFMRPEEVPPVVEDAIKIGAKVVWMQEGIVNQEAAERAEQAGLLAVQDMCMRVAHRYFFE
jgi:uncharacterized protein